MKDRRSLGINVVLVAAVACSLMVSGCFEQARKVRSSVNMRRFTTMMG
ncbi:MAG: hypothetical protein ACYTFK_04800 [Planctomycetota bacterium]